MTYNSQYINWLKNFVYNLQLNINIKNAFNYNYCII